MNFSAKVQNRLDELGTNQSWLARKLGTSTTQLSRWLDDNPRRKYTYRQLFAFAVALDLPPEYLLNDECKDREDMQLLGFPDAWRDILTAARAVGFENAKKMLRANSTVQPVSGIQNYKQILANGDSKKKKP